ncbi:MAG: hypothetical protein QOI82_1851 [Actinomycetota bacterium]|jgi:hypothetical protein|nr:hypothetical protein [Actinomycetota bacterium]
MTPRRLILVALVAGLLGSSGTAAFAGVGTTPDNKRVCVMTTDDPTTHSWDGVCVSVPIH